jgi:hypothetical protein
LNAQAAGASAVVIFNEGQPGRTDLIVGTLGTAEFNIPVVGLSFTNGAAIVEQLRGGATVMLHVFTSTESEVRQTYNVLAETDKKGDPNASPLNTGIYLHIRPATTLPQHLSRALSRPSSKLTRPTVPPDQQRQATLSARLLPGPRGRG